MSQLGRDATGIWWVETRDALSTLQYTGQLLTTKASPAPSVDSGEVENLGIDGIMYECGLSGSQ